MINYKNHSINSDMKFEESNKISIAEDHEFEDDNQIESEANVTNINNKNFQLSKSNTSKHPINNGNHEEEASCKEHNFSKSYLDDFHGNNLSLNNSKNNNNYGYSNDKKKFKLSNTMAFLINLKKMIFIFILLFAMLETSFLKLAYFLLAIFFAYNFRDKGREDISTKRYIVFITMFFAFSFLTFKIIIFLLFQRELSQKEKEILFSLNCEFLKNREDYSRLIASCLIEIVIIVYSLIYILTCWNYRENLDLREIRKIRMKFSESKVSFLFVILYLFYYCILITYVSFTTVLISVVIHVGLILKIFKFHSLYNSYAFKFLNFINIIRILVAEVLNVYWFRLKFQNSNLKWTFSIIGFIINPPDLSTNEPYDPVEKKQWEEDRMKLLKFSLDFIFTILSIVLYIFISTLRVITPEDKKKSLLKRHQREIFSHSNNEGSSVSFINKKLNPKANKVTFSDIQQKEQNININSTDKHTIKSKKSFPDKQILYTINENEFSKTHLKDSESLPLKQTIYDYDEDQKEDNFTDPLAELEKNEEININKLKIRSNSELIKNSKEIEKSYEDINSLKLEREEDKINTEIRNIKRVNSDNLEENNYQKNKHFYGEENITDKNDKDSIKETSNLNRKNSQTKDEKNTQIKDQKSGIENLIEEEDPTLKQIAFHKPGEIEEDQILKDKDLISLDEEENEENHVEDIDENLASDEDESLSSSEIEEEKDDKSKKINKCLYIIERFFHGIYKFYKKIKSFLYAYLISAYFRLDICRICIIYWIYQYANFQTIPLILWLFFTIQAESLFKIKIVTFIFAWPSLLINYYCFIISNIDNLIGFKNIPQEDVYLNIYGLEQFEFPSAHFAFLHFTIIAFTFLSIDLNKNKTEIQELSNSNESYNKTNESALRSHQNEINQKDKNYQSSEMNLRYFGDKNETTDIINNLENLNMKKKTKNLDEIESTKTFIELEDKSDDNINVNRPDKMGYLSEELKNKYKKNQYDKKDFHKRIENLDRNNYNENLLSNEEERNNFEIGSKKKTKEFQKNPKKVFLEGIRDTQPGF